MPMHDRLLDEAWTNSLLDARGRWTRGPIRPDRIERIGVGYGLSGVVYRVHATDFSGAAVTLVAKIEEPDLTRRAIAAHASVEPVLGSSVPTCMGSHVDDEAGLLLLEDVRPAVQGDELVECEVAQAVGLVHVVAGLHAHTIDGVDVDTAADQGLDIWRAVPADEERWATTLSTATARYPALFAGVGGERVERIRDAVVDASAVLDREQVSWVHVDPHLDNVLWRPDGSTVLLDWSNARIGPPVTDVSKLLFTLAFCERPAMTPDEVMATYVSELAQHAVSVDVPTFESATSLALVVHLQGVVGWSGQSSDTAFHHRKATLRDNAIDRVFRALHWLDR